MTSKQEFKCVDAKGNLLPDGWEKEIRNASFFYINDYQVVFNRGFGDEFLKIVIRATQGLYGLPLPIDVLEDFLYVAMRYGGISDLDKIKKCTFWEQPFFNKYFFIQKEDGSVYEWDLDEADIMCIPSKNFVSLPPHLADLIWPTDGQNKDELKP